MGPATEEDFFDLGIWPFAALACVDDVELSIEESVDEVLTLEVVDIDDDEPVKSIVATGAADEALDEDVEDDDEDISTE